MLRPRPSPGVPRGHLRLVAEALRTTWTTSRRGTLTALALHVVGAVSALGVVLASKLALDALLGRPDDAGVSAGLVVALVVLAVSTALAGSVGVLQAQHQRVLGEQVAQRLWDGLLAACLHTDLITWESTDFMDRLDRVRAHALSRPTAVVSALFSIGGSLLGVLALASVLAAIEPLLIPVLLAAGVPVVLVSRAASRSEFAFAISSNAVRRRSTYLKGLATGRAYAAELRAFEAGDWLLDQHAAADRDHLAALRRQARTRQLLGLLSTVATALSLAAALLLIVWLADRGRISLAEAGAAAIAARLLGGQLTTVFGSVGSLIESGPFLADMRSLVGPAISAGPAPKRATVPCELRAVEVSFTYPGHARAAVEAVDIVVPPGQVVAVVGENGSGKTTLAKIVAGLYEPSRGFVTWDGTPASGDQLRSGVSVVFQDFVRYQLSALDNIAIGRTSVEADPRLVAAAAERAGVHDAIMSLSDGYETPLGVELAEGSDLSGGQWQRIALARALYRDSPVVVLDEPMAAMDPRAEHELFADVRRLLDGRSALVISHRYSGVRLADRIYVMHEGRVVEEGTHAELVALDGRYAELYELQASGYLQ